MLQSPQGRRNPPLPLSIILNRRRKVVLHSISMDSLAGLHHRDLVEAVSQDSTHLDLDSIHIKVVQGCRFLLGKAPQGLQDRMGAGTVDPLPDSPQINSDTHRIQCLLGLLTTRRS
jgi:hypothetical protein